MKKIKLLILLFIALFAFPVYASTFETTYDIDTEIDGNKVYLKLGIKEQYMQAVSGVIKYDASKVKLVNAVGINGFTVTTSDKEETEGKFHIVKYEADTSEDTRDTGFMELTFTITDSFRVGKTADIFFTDYEIANSSLKKYRDEGVLLTLDRAESKLMLFNQEDYDDSLRTRLWFMNHLYIFIIVALLIIGGIVAILMSPSKRKVESREDNIRDLKKNGSKNNENMTNFVGKMDHFEQAETFVDTPFKDSEAKFVEEKAKVEDPLANLKDDGIEELKDEELAFFNPDLDSIGEDDHNDTNITSFILVLLLASAVLFTGVGHASSDDIYNIRDCIVGNNKYRRDYDLNEDKKVDVLDVVYWHRNNIVLTEENNNSVSDVIADNSVDIED